MADMLEGGYRYTTRYVIERDGSIYGPFDGMVQAVTVALERFEAPFTITPCFTPHSEECSK